VVIVMIPAYSISNFFEGLPLLGFISMKMLIYFEGAHLFFLSIFEIL